MSQHKSFTETEARTVGEQIGIDWTTAPGTHDESIRLRTGDLLSVAEAEVVDISRRLPLPLDAVATP